MTTKLETVVKLGDVRAGVGPGCGPWKDGGSLPFDRTVFALVMHAGAEMGVLEHVEMRHPRERQTSTSTATHSWLCRAARSLRLTRASLRLDPKKRLRGTRPLMPYQDRHRYGSCRPQTPAASEAAWLLVAEFLGSGRHTAPDCQIPACCNIPRSRTPGDPASCRWSAGRMIPTSWSPCRSDSI